jgi:uncharacterized membrane protein YeaQ/YmgE (transglycosylase-associated protein family)
MGIIANLIVGALVGWLASIIAKTNDQMGCLWNIVVGIVGAAIGFFIARLLFDDVNYNEFSISGVLISLVGALLLVFLLKSLGILKRDKR